MKQSEMISDDSEVPKIRHLTFSKLVLSLCLTSIAVLILAAIYQPLHTQLVKGRQELTFLSAHWNVTCNGKEYDDVTLPRLGTGVLPKGTVITLSNVLPEFSGSKSLWLHSYYSELEVRSGADTIYTYQTDALNSKTYIGDCDHFIPLSEADSGQTLTIVLTLTEPMAVSSFTVPVIGNESDFIRYIMGSNLTGTFSGIFLVVFGLIAILISCMTILMNRQFLRLMLSGAFSLDVGIWVLCFYNYVEIISSNATYNSMMEFISLYLIPVWTMLFFALIYSGRRKKTFLILSSIDIGFVVAVLFCHTVLSIHLNNFLIFFHILALVEVLFSFVMIAGNLKRREHLKRFQEKVLLTGLIVFMLCGAADLINYNLQKYLCFHFMQQNSILFLPLGAVFFVVSLLMNYFYFIMDNMVQQKEKEQLLNIAYVDKLTQISNRTKCERDMKILEDGSKPYAIISFDLNHLKQVNDTYGHSMGDKLISGFATILDKCFGNIGTVGRMGGDEFIVMVSAQGKDTINQRLLAMEALLAKESRKDERLQFSSSYGTAYSADHPEMTAFQLYKLADSKMYEMKIRVEGPKAR